MMRKFAEPFAALMRLWVVLDAFGSVHHGGWARITGLNAFQQCVDLIRFRNRNLYYSLL